MPNISFKHPAYEKNLPKWVLIDDCINGSLAIKKKGDTYLPRPNAADTSEKNQIRYEQYVTRAVFYNVTASTLTGLVGQVFAKPSIVEVPSNYDNIIEDVDGANLTIEQQAKQTLEFVVAKGRAGLLVDFPITEGVVTVQDQQDGSARPNIFNYRAESIINWRHERFGAENKLTLVVIAEIEDEDVDGFASHQVRQLRVLRLTEQTYHVEIYRQTTEAVSESASGDYLLFKEFTPVGADGNPLDEIPFTFVGSENNDPCVDLPPLYDLAVLNLAHYRNSADYEESSYIAGQPTPFLTGLSQAWVDTVLKNTVHLGSRAAIMLPEGGSAGLLQAESNSMPFEAMELKERQMVALGAKLVEQKTVQRTATEAGADTASAVSVLASSANNVSSAYMQALEWAGVFIGDEQEILVTLNTDFGLFKLTAQDIAGLVGAWQAEAITYSEMRDNLRRANIASLDDEEALTMIEQSILDGLITGNVVEEEPDDNIDDNNDE